MKKRCLKCGKIWENDGNFCEACGGQLVSVVETKQNNKNYIPIICIAIAGVCVVITLFSVILSNMNSSYQDYSDYEEDEMISIEVSTEDSYEQSFEQKPTSRPTVKPTVTPTTSPDYILPNSSSQRLTLADLDGLTKDQLRYARNEIYARHGRKFNDTALQAYFNAKPWYRGTIEPDAFSESLLNQIEKDNIGLIKQMEAK